MPLRWEGTPVKLFQSFHRKLVYPSIPWILKASSHLHGEQSTYIDDGAPSSADVLQNNLHSDSTYSLNVFLVLKTRRQYHSLGCSGAGATTELLHFTLQTVQLHSCGTSIPATLPDVLSPNLMSCIWELYGCPPYYKRFCGGFVISQGPSLLGVGMHRDPCWVPVPRSPGLMCTTVWHIGNKNNCKAPEACTLTARGIPVGFPCKMFVFYKEKD